MNLFSGSTNLWTILGEYEPFNMLLQQCKGLLSGSYGPKTGQNCMKYEVLGTVRTFSLMHEIWLLDTFRTVPLNKSPEWLNFLTPIINGEFWEVWAYRCTSLVA